jgi:hypothetical protein
LFWEGVSLVFLGLRSDFCSLLGFWEGIPIIFLVLGRNPGGFLNSGKEFQWFLGFGEGVSTVS